jgi:hypothetical protein
MILRWIDLGCPIDFDHAADAKSLGWNLDDTRPTLTVALPVAGKNAALDRLVIGMHDYASGIDAGSFQVTADVTLDGLAAGENLAGRFRETSPGAWEWTLSRPMQGISAKLTVSVKDRQGHESRIVRAFAVP